MLFEKFPWATPEEFERITLAAIREGLLISGRWNRSERTRPHRSMPRSPAARRVVDKGEEFPRGAMTQKRRKGCK